MGHSQFGARVVYGDCLFITLSPDPVKSAMVLRLARYRKTDPCVVHGDEGTKLLAQRDYPSMEAKEVRGTVPSAQRGLDTEGQSEQRAAEDFVEVDIPNYLERLKAVARQPLAVADGYRLELKRFADILGVRMCPSCPRCNATIHGCQDMFGCNMRPLGGVLGGTATMGGGTEHQIQGAPHLHCEVHVVCVYQYCTLEEIANKIRDQLVSAQELMNYNEHLHRTDLLDDERYHSFRPHVEAAFDNRFADPSHDAMCVTPAFLAKDATCNKAYCSTCKGAAPPEYGQDVELRALQEEGAVYRSSYLQDAQYVFSRVQHHVHRKTKNGYRPLHNCAKKRKEREQVHGLQT